jgi:phospholipid transport system substrate-binding protein
MTDTARNPWKLTAIALALGALVTATRATAGVPTDQLRLEIERVVQTLEDPDLKVSGRAGERRQRVRAIANGIFDWSETARRSLARHWQPLTDAQRDEFVQLLADLVERAYISKIEMYSGEKIAYLGDAVDGEQARVRTQVVTKQGTDVPIEYRMLRRGDRWRVYDVVVENVSFVSNYRSQFNRIIQTSSYDDLVAKLRAKSREIEAPGRPAQQ